LFLEALKFASIKSDKKIRAFIVGDGDSRQTIELKAKELGLPFIDGTKSKDKSLLTFTSWIKDVDFVLAGSDIVALTSFNEGTPVSLIEAQAAGKAIVTTNVGGIENVVNPRITALLAENNNSEQFSNQLIILIEDKELRNKITNESWNFVRNKYHFTRLVSDIEKLYKSLL
jgi:glycosyltransferase involved in cell wall biosynthesis